MGLRKIGFTFESFEHSLKISLSLESSKQWDLSDDEPNFVCNFHSNFNRLNKYEDQQLELAIFETMTVVIETANIQKQIFCTMIYMVFNTLHYDYVVDIWLSVLFSLLSSLSLFSIYFSFRYFCLPAALIFIIIIAHRSTFLRTENSKWSTKTARKTVSMFHLLFSIPLIFLDRNK